MKNLKQEASKQFGYTYVDQKTFAQLEQLVLTFNESEETDDAIKILSISSKRNIGKVIRAKNYVGVLQVNDRVQIEILQKIQSGTTEATCKIVYSFMIKVTNKN